MLIVFAVIVAGLFGIAGTFLTIEAKRAAIAEENRRDSSGDRSANWQSISSGE